MTSTSIEWTNKSWNPVRGCSLVSAGCKNCYAMKQAHRFSGAGQPYEGLTEVGPDGPRWTGKVRLVPDVLDAPLHWKKPSMIFVNSMGDLFHEDVPFDFIDLVLVRSMWTPHVYQILTKRPDRMLEYFSSDVERRIWKLNDKPVGMMWPLPNIWLGVSVENQATADERIAILIKTPAAVKWVSVEPLLEEIDVSMFMATGWTAPPYDDTINWLVIGGESGPHARPFNIEWARSLITQCHAAGLPVFMKQLGSMPVSGLWNDGRGLGTMKLKSRKGGDPSEWPADLRVREFPQSATEHE